MISNLDTEGLSKIAFDYDLFYIDIWGVIHNGLELNLSAIETLKKLEQNKKKFVLLTNAPRPNESVIEFLKKMGLKDYYDKVFTSGEAALKYLKSDLNNKKFFHIGPPRDFDLFSSFKNFKETNIDLADYILCTGLFDNYDKDLDYYKTLLKEHLTKKMICTNPDLIVDRGNIREYCAGSVAKVFENLKGEVIYFGKPYPPVYELSAETRNKKVLCIGDNLNTDIKGANVQNFDALLITGGIHRNEISDKKIENLTKSYNVKVNYIQTELKWWELKFIKILMLENNIKTELY